MTPSSRHRLDDLRRHAAALAAAAGLPGPAAMALANHLLWHDAAGAPQFGIRTLPAWLDRLQSGQVAPITEARVLAERATIATLDGRNGVGPLVLAHAATIAAQKARELGTGLVRLRNLPATFPAAEIAATHALGPLATLILGPRPSWTLALPTAGDLPTVFDSDLPTPPAHDPPRKKPPAAAMPPPSPLAPLVAALAPPPDGWLIAAATISALEPLTTFHELLAERLPTDEAPGQLLPAPWESRRRALREHGLALDPETESQLKAHARRLNVPVLP